MKKVVFIVCWLVGHVVSAQDSIVIRGEVMDRLQKMTISNAQILTVSGADTFFTKAGYHGNFSVKVPKSERYLLTATHPLYQESFREFYNSKKKDTLEVVIEMNASSVIDTVVVHPTGVPQKLFADSLLSVADFEVLKDGNLLLLTYPKRLSKGSELILWNPFTSERLNRMVVPEARAQELVRDYRGNPHLVCEKKVYGIYVDGFRIQVSTLEKDYFQKYLSPILDTNKSKLYFSTFNKDYPAFDYYSFDQLDSTYTKIVSITDKLMMELYRSEYKWADVRVKIWAKTKEYETGIDAEIWVGANYFTQSIYYKELYAPMFHRNDTLFVFDYYRDQLMRFDAKGEQIDSIPIYHHYHPKETGWKKKLIQDRVTGQIYAVMDIAGYTYIRLVNTDTGELGNKVKLEYRYVEKVEIYDNQAFYIYRKFESPQKKFLYKEKLPFYFPPANVPQGDLVKGL